MKQQGMSLWDTVVLIVAIVAAFVGGMDLGRYITLHQAQPPHHQAAAVGYCQQIKWVVFSGAKLQAYQWSTVTSSRELSTLYAESDKVYKFTKCWRIEK